jgi:predicted RNA-binding protein with PIN domain
MIFKQGSCEQELFEGMQEAQQEVILEEAQQRAQTIYAALELLNNAAECFERVGRKVRAEEVTTVMVSLADSSEQQTLYNSKKEAADVFEFFGYKPKDLGLADD